jgi:hypothetical protein
MDSTTWGLWLKTATLLGGIFAAFWAYRTYNDTKKKEYYAVYWNKKLELFLAASQAASTMATTTSLVIFKSARENYWKLYYGPLSLVEGKDVKRAMQVFAKKVPNFDPSALPLSSLQTPAYQLTIAMRNELGESWTKPFSELPFYKIPVDDTRAIPGSAPDVAPDKKP